jgi:hypothetical protein
MKDLMFGEFAKYQVLPLDASASPRFVTPRPSLAAGRKVFTYSGSAVSIPNGNQPSTLNTSYTLMADINVPQGEAEGVIVNTGGRFYGWALYLLKGKPVFTYNLLDLRRTRWEGTEALAPGKHTIEYAFKYDGLGEATLAYNNTSGVGRGGTGTLKMDSKVISTQKQEGSLPLVTPLDITFDIGLSGANPVDDRDYQVPFNFTGKIDKVTITLDPPKLTPKDIRKLEAGNRAAADQLAITGHWYVRAVLKTSANSRVIGKGFRAAQIRLPDPRTCVSLAPRWARAPSSVALRRY